MRWGGWRQLRLVAIVGQGAVEERRPREEEVADGFAHHHREDQIPVEGHHDQHQNIGQKSLEV